MYMFPNRNDEIKLSLQTNIYSLHWFLFHILCINKFHEIKKLFPNEYIDIINNHTLTQLYNYWLLVYDCQVQPVVLYIEVLYIEVLYIDEGICTKFNVSTPIAMSKTEVHELHPLVITYIPMITNKLHGIEKKKQNFVLHY